MKIIIGENDICNTCQYKNPLISITAGCQPNEEDCPAEYSDVFLDDTRNISDCKCYVAQIKKKKSVKTAIIIPDEISSAFQEFKKMRQKIKAPLTDIAVRRLINRLNELAPNNYALQNEMLLNSVDNCWKGVFLPKNSVSKDKLQSKPSYDLEQIKRDAMLTPDELVIAKIERQLNTGIRVTKSDVLKICAADSFLDDSDAEEILNKFGARLADE